MTGEMSAADAAVLFDGARLTMARHLAGMRKSELAKVVNKSPTAVTGWESGAKRPSPPTVAQLALRLGVDPAFFTVSADEVVVPSSAPHFRSLRATTQMARDQALSYGQLAYGVASSLERHVEFPGVEIPSFPVETDNMDGEVVEEAARMVRRAWGLANGPLPHLLRLLENHGVLVVFSPPQAASVDAYSFDSRRRPVIILNSMKRDYYRQRFDLAHELGHLVMHADAEPGGRVVEDQAHRFASELLMPEQEIASLLPSTMSTSAWSSLARLKEHWGVSMQALLFRARHLGVLSDVSYRNAMVTVSKRGWRRNEPGQVKVLEQPSLLPKAVELLAAEGIEERVLATECRTPLELFRAATSRAPLALPTAVSATKSDERAILSLLPVRMPSTEITTE
jgi:Zn-dependent peptidase ImmA (M78 family)/transcriptional regulator with XRE-family HTH domain